MKHKTTRSLYAYWNEVRGDRLAPKRFEIEPARIGAILPDTFILERVSAQAYTFRLAGTRIHDQFMAEFRGVDFLDGWSAVDRATLEDQLSTMGQQGGVALLTMLAATSGGRSARFEVLILPLVHTRDSIDRFLGSIAALEEPDWFGSEPLVGKSLLHHEMIWPEGRPYSLVDKIKHQVPFLPHVRSARIVRADRRQFRVYEGGRPASDPDKT